MRIGRLLLATHLLRTTAIHNPIGCGVRGVQTGMADEKPPLLSLEVSRSAPAAGKPTRVSAPMPLASYARDALGILHFPGTPFLRSFKKPVPPQDLSKGQDSFVDKAEDMGNSVDPILQGVKAKAPPHTQTHAYVRA